jgi:hypothetical protein
MTDTTGQTEHQRTADAGAPEKNPGPYLARVLKHSDPYYLGGLEVELLKTTEAGNVGETLGQTAIVYYASPFYGITQSTSIGKNDTYSSTQKSYGFWAIPPDPGSLVLCTFVEGSREFGYWFACVPEKGMTYMLPAGQPATEQLSGPVPSELKGKRLPAGEYNKAITKPQTNNVIKYKRPVNEDFVNQLKEQGLVEDDIRGITSSSAQREFPSAVIGISSPGPVDKRGGSPQGEIGIKESKATVHVSRLGSSSFVIDDGDDKLIRKGDPKDTPYEYINKEASGKGGDVTRPHNEMIRLRTRTGAQIVMHTSEDLIYINNSRGTCWIEMSSNGKLDVYAQDSVSFHTEVDINFTADRDINFEAGRNINMIVNENIFQSAAANLEIKVGVNGNITTGAEINIKSGSTFKNTAGGDFSIGATNTTIKGGDIHLNGPDAPEAAEAVKAKFPQRVPQHEPWNGHENWNPPETEPEKTEAVETESQDVHPEDRTVQTDRTAMNEL